MSDSGIQLHPIGVERYNNINESTTLSDLRYSKSYETPNFLSDFIPLNNTDKTKTTELLAIYDTASKAFPDRERDGTFWISTHAVVYDHNTAKMEELYIQEDYDHNMALDENTAVINSLLARIEALENK